MDSQRKKQVLYKASCALLTVILIMFIAMGVNNTRIRAIGLRTVAIVSDVESNLIYRRGQGYRRDHVTTFEFMVDNHVYHGTRRTRTNGRFGSAPWVIGELVDIYYSPRRPANFIFAAEGSTLGAGFWIPIVVCSGVLGFLTYKIKTGKPKRMEKQR